MHPTLTPYTYLTHPTSLSLTITTIMDNNNPIVPSSSSSSNNSNIVAIIGRRGLLARARAQRRQRRAAGIPARPPHRRNRHIVAPPIIADPEPILAPAVFENLVDPLDIVDEAPDIPIINLPEPIARPQVPIIAKAIPAALARDDRLRFPRTST